MKYGKTVKAIFVERPNRFIAVVKLTNGSLETVHVKNTGRCKELLLPGVEVILEEGTNPARKTRYDLIAVYKEYRLTNGSMFVEHGSKNGEQQVSEAGNLEGSSSKLTNGSQNGQNIETNDSYLGKSGGEKQTIGSYTAEFIAVEETNGNCGKPVDKITNDNVYFRDESRTNGSFTDKRKENCSEGGLTNVSFNKLAGAEISVSEKRNDGACFNHLTNDSCRRMANERLLVNIDSQAPNKVVAEWLSDQGFDYIKPEYTYGDSRIDFYMRKGSQEYLMEVKGCTLEVDGQGYFPDAPTERGVKHLRELTNGSKSGIKCYLAFVIQMEGVQSVLPNVATHAAFGQALAEAQAAGVEVLYLHCGVCEDSLFITDREGTL